MTAAFCEQEDEEVGLTEKEMREEASVTPGWVGVSKPKGSARLSGKGGKKPLRTRTLRKPKQVDF